MQTPSHVLYFDDILIFYKGVKRELLYVKQLIMEYAQAFGQQINQTKCKFYTCKAAARKIGSIASFLGFSVGCMSFSYLGVPLFLGKLKKVHLHPISYRILNKMATWKGSTLPIMGTIELVKSILDGISPSARYFKPSIWHGIRDNWVLANLNSIWLVGDGLQINLWRDNWIGDSLVDILGIPQ
ncbi:hypothetical protein Lal_00035535 [Lupinus albus]|nr:hypothetical protein Lal_00035532 [Lupinus albus]KAF1884407.1 hypothetical protein Lal_00035535 [Lupinus albus]